MSVASERFNCERLRLIERCEVGGDLIRLAPRESGHYVTPAPLTAANPYGCHNRPPFKTTVSVPDGAMPDGHSFPFRMAMDCQYTLSDLGQKDPRCVGCKWRRVS